MDSTTTILFLTALIFSVGFLLLIILLVPAINRLRSTLEDMEKTSVQVRDLAIKLKELSVKVDRDVEKFDAVLNASKETAEVVADSVKLINRNFLKKSAGLLAFIPAIKFGWNLVRKFKGGKKQ
jgi:uncharacterized protein YoxC